MEDAAPLSPEPAQLLLTIRFSASIHDIPIEVPSPSTTTGAGLKQLIRAKLPPELSARHLRLIHSGKPLDDATPLAVSLNWKGQKRPELDTEYPGYYTYAGDEEAQVGETYSDPQDRKGKEPVRNVPPPKRVYIHCSIGDIVLDDGEIAEEARLAIIAQQRRLDGEYEETQGPSAAPGAAPATTTTMAAPRGFDRLLSTGFTVAEVSTLRSQFLALQSLSHTPDTMPSGEELRRLEDRWMDEGSTRDGAQDSGGTGGGFTNDEGGGGLGSGGPAGLDDMTWGCVMGFFWPVGCALWLLREDGVWSWRKGLAVFVGVVVNFGLGAIRAMNT